MSIEPPTTSERHRSAALPEMPQRIQRKRAPGWRLPANTICVTRGTKWGNPFKVGETLENGTVITPTLAVALYGAYLRNHPKLVTEAKTWLKGHNLACWCKPGLPCHADILLEVANET